MTPTEEIARLRAALKEFGEHHVSCLYNDRLNDANCTCGFTAARAALAIEPAPEAVPTGRTYCKGGCGAPYGEDGWVEAILPNEIWNEVFQEDGAWCFRCITKRLESLGRTGIPVLVVGTPYADANEKWRLIGIEHGRLVERGLNWHERRQLAPLPPAPSPDIPSHEWKATLDELAAIIHQWPEDGTRRTYATVDLAQSLLARLATPSPDAALSAADVLLEKCDQLNHSEPIKYELDAIYEAAEDYRAARQAGEVKR